MHKICKIGTALVITFCRWNKSLSRLRFFGRVHKDINLHKHPHSYGNRFITYEVPSRHRTLPVLNLTKPYAAGWNENDLLLHSEKIREKWQDRQSPGARWKRKSPVGGSVLGTTIIPVDDVGTRVIGGRKDRMQRRGKNGWNERGHGM